MNIMNSMYACIFLQSVYSLVLKRSVLASYSESELTLDP